MSFSPPPASTKNPAPSPTPTATSRWCARPPTAPASSPTSKSSSASPEPWAPTSRLWFPSAKRGTTADLGQSRGAQAGEADRHAVWLEANGLEPKLSPFDPLAVLDEIERLVPGYTLDRINLFAGNDVHTEPKATPGFVPLPRRSPARTSSFPRTTRSSPRERWAVTALRSSNSTNIKRKEMAESAAD